MIERIVRMSFRQQETEHFVKVFGNARQAIAAFPGCTGLRLMRDVNQPNVFLTYSLWESEEALNAYRKSPLFKETWALTRALFDEKPVAWSIQTVDLVK